MNVRSTVSSATKKFKPSKRVLIGAAIVAVLVALFVLGTIVQVRAERQHQADVRADATEQATKDTLKDNEITDLKKQVAVLQGDHTDKLLLCSYISTLERAPATKGRLAKPVAAHCP